MREIDCTGTENCDCAICNAIYQSGFAAGREATVARIVAWLRNEYGGNTCTACDDEIALAIERGDWRVK